MQKQLADAIGAYQKGDLKGALRLLDRLPSALLPLQALALKANIHAKLDQHGPAGETFLKAARKEGSDKPLLYHLAARMLIAAGARPLLAAAGHEILNVVANDPAVTTEVLSALLAEGRAREAAGFCNRLDPADPGQAILGINILREAGFHAERMKLINAALLFRLDDGMLNAERFAAAQDMCDFAVKAECRAMLSDPDSAAGRNMFAAQSLHRRLLWCDDEALNARPGLDHFLLDRQMAGSPLPRRQFGPAGQKIRIAYLSCDFYSHATMVLFRQVLMEHDRDRFDIRLFCYSPADKVHEQAGWPEPLRSEIEPVRDLDDRAAAEAISRWKADILVDLKGFTAGSRLGIVRLSDTPLKATWIGYPGSVNTCGIDYNISDRFVTPDTSIPFYEEKLCRLPESYQPNDSTGRAEPSPTSRAAHGLPDDAFVFASFNNVFKITGAIVNAWADVLKRTPGSILWCLAPEAARANLLKALAGPEVSAERIVFMAPASYAAHLSRIALADLVLDTCPYNGHTTASDALWAGAPFLGLSGHTFAARVSESLLEAVGLPELVTRDLPTYADRAVNLHDDRTQLAELRARLAENRRIKPLFDGERLTRHVETAFEMMAERARMGLSPDHIDVPALPARQTPFI